jgi:hypothetical protein
MQGIQERGDQFLPKGIIQIEGYHLGREVADGKTERRLQNKVSLEAIVLAINDDSRLTRIKMNHIDEFTSKAIKAWASNSFKPGNFLLRRLSLLSRFSRNAQRAR